MDLCIDYKVTVWRRMHFKENVNPTIIIQSLMEGATTNDLEELESYSYDEFLYDTEEDMSVEENGGFDTKEVIIDGQTIWDNKNGYSKIDN